MNPARTTLALGALLGALSTVAGAQADPHVGTWKLDVARSSYSPGPAPRSGTRTYEANDDGLKFTQTLVTADGTPSTSQWEAHFDGVYQPLAGVTQYDSIAFKRLDRRTFEALLKKEGRVVLRSTTVVSENGKVLTSTAIGTNPDGQPVHNVTVWIRQ